MGKIYIPKMGANIDSVEITNVLKKEGDHVKKGDILFQMMTEKAVFDVDAEEDGVILKLDCHEGDSANVLDEVGFIGKPGDKVPQLSRQSVKEDSSGAAPQAPPDQAQAKGSVKATPAARKLAKEKGLDLEAVFKGVDRIIRDQDVLDAVQKSPVPDSGAEEFEAEKISAGKRVEIRHLSASREYLPSSVTIEIEARKIDALAAKEAPSMRFSKGQVISWQAARQLSKSRLFNSYFHDDSIRKYSRVNIGVALNVGHGLVVPVIHDADKMSLADYAEAYFELSKKAVAGELKPDDLAGGTFTVTDLSAARVRSFQPIINDRQSAILGISSPRYSLAKKDDKIVPVLVFEVSLTFDHRVADGKQALDFLHAVRQGLG